MCDGDYMLKLIPPIASSFEETLLFSLVERNLNFCISSSVSTGGSAKRSCYSGVSQGGRPTQGVTNILAFCAELKVDISNIHRVSLTK